MPNHFGSLCQATILLTPLKKPTMMRWEVLSFIDRILENQATKITHVDHKALSILQAVDLLSNWSNKKAGTKRYRLFYFNK